jgi:hypothetical protein
MKRELWTLLVIGVAVLVISLLLVRLSNVGRELTIAEANTLAAQDTTRQHLVGENQGLSLLVEQQSIDIDDIGAVLGTSQDSVKALTTALEDRDVDHLAVVQAMHIAFEEVTAENVQLNADITTMTRDGQAVRVVALDVESDGVSGDIDISVPLDSTQATEIEFVKLTVHPFGVTYAIGCEETNAVVAVQAPAHITLTLTPGIVDPAVCIPPGRTLGWVSDIFSLSPSNVLWGAAGALSVLLLVR